MTQVAVNGNVYSDDGSAAKDMRSGGFRAWLLPMLSDAMTTVAAGLASIGGAWPFYTPSAPTNGGTTTTASKERVRAFTHSSTIATHTLTLPPSPADGDTFRLDLRSEITALTVNGGTGGASVIGGSGGLAPAGTSLSWRYVNSGSLNVWICEQSLGVVPIARGGTNATSQTTNGVVYHDGTKNTSGSSLTWDGNKFGIGATAAFYTVQIHSATNQNFSVSGNGTLADGSTVFSHNDANNALVGLEWQASKFLFSVGNVGIGVSPISGVLLDVNGLVRPKSYTVGTLPTGVTGAVAYVTDSSVTTFGSTVAGGGANNVPVRYNGSNWVVG